MTYLLPLAAADDPARSGRKAVGLRLAAAAGLRVPPAMVLTAEALTAHLERHAGSAGPVAAIEAGDLPPAVAREVHAAAEFFSGVPHGVVVRSSAPGEDGTELSFAGQFTSVFAPATTTGIEAAVRQVWASAFGGGIREYERSRAGRVTAEPAMAVLIQRALNPWCSGVLAADAGGGGSLLAEACIGLPIPVVQGLVRPEVLSSKRPGDTVVHAGDRFVCVLSAGGEGDGDVLPGDLFPVSTPDGTDRWKVVWREPGGVLVYLQPPQPVQDLSPLGPADEAGLRDLVRRLPDLGGAGLDVEWARDADGLHLLQVRPLTTPVPMADRAVTPEVAPGEWETLQGRPAAPGRVEGPVWVAPSSGVDPGQMPDGAILVCSALTTDLLPALLRAAAVISGEAGVLAHTAIVARELGRPCVLNIQVGSGLLRTGEVVHVDGDRGTVRPVGGAVPEPVDAAEPKAEPEFEPDGLLLVATRHAGGDGAAGGGGWQGVMFPTDPPEAALRGRLASAGWTGAPVAGGGELWCPGASPGSWTVDLSGARARLSAAGRDPIVCALRAAAPAILPPVRC